MRNQQQVGCLSEGLTNEEGTAIDIKAKKRFHVLFLFISQPHQTLHSLPIAFEMARRHSDIDVYVTCLTQSHLSYVQELASLYDNPPINYQLLPIPTWLRNRIAWKGPGIIWKVITLFLSRKYFNNFDALVVPERTTLYLKRMGITRPRYIYTQHGAGDRAVGFAKDIKEFDFVLIPGDKIEKRFLKTNLVRKDGYYKGSYVKFDIVRKIQKQKKNKIFNNDRLTVFYNPHFFPGLTSWHSIGRQVVDFFAHQDKYNLICAPHYRLFDAKNKKCRKLIKKYEKFDNILIDPGSPQSIDMTYVMAADIYLGDVSSQVAEFLIEDRPCIFLNPYYKNWKDDDNYRFWHLGQVINDVGQLQNALDMAHTHQQHYAPLQKDYYKDTFANAYNDTPSAPEAANAIVDYLNRDYMNKNHNLAST